MLGDVEKIRKELNDEEEKIDSEGSEDFHKGQRTQKADDYDQFSKLMRQKIEFSIGNVLEKLTCVIQQYEQILNQSMQNQNQIGNMTAEQLIGKERQLTYLVKVVNSLFSYGLPSSSSKLPVRYATQQQQFEIKNRYDDLTVFSRIIYIMKLINQVKQ